MEREIDVIEEIARIHGYDKFPEHPAPIQWRGGSSLPDEQKDAHLREELLAIGYNEAMSLTFIAGDEARRFTSAAPVEIANPSATRPPSCAPRCCPACCRCWPGT